MSNVQSLETRLARLESSSRRWRTACVTLGLALLLVAGLGLKNADDGKVIKDLQANNITLVDAKGNARILLSAVGDNGLAAIHISDSNQKRAVSLRVDDDNASIGCFDHNAKERVKLVTTAKGAGTYYMDANQKPRLVVATTEAANWSS